MNIRRTRWLPGGALALALALAACGPAGTSGQAPTEAPATVPTSAPTLAPAQTEEPTTPPAPTEAPTSAPVPTGAPTEAPAPTAAPAPTGALPSDMPWVRVGDNVYGDDEVLDFQARGLPVPIGRVHASPDGAYIAYTTQESKLVVIETRTFGKVVGDEESATPIGFAFAPDSRSLAVTLLDQQNNWRLRVLDLAGGAARTLADGKALASSGDDFSLVPMPLAWRPNGLFVQHVLWATDAPPQSIALVNPADGAVQVVRKDAHIVAYPSPDGGKVAIVTGMLRIGEPPSSGIAVLDLASGQERTLVPEAQRVVRQLRWSPDSSRLLYASAIGYESGMTTIHALGADGSSERSLDVGISGSVRVAYADVAWRDGQTALLLAGEADGAAHLYALPLGAFEAAGLQPLAAFPRGQAQPGMDAIVFTPGA